MKLESVLHPHWKPEFNVDAYPIDEGELSLYLLENLREMSGEDGLIAFRDASLGSDDVWRNIKVETKGFSRHANQLLNIIIELLYDNLAFSFMAPHPDYEKFNRFEDFTKNCIDFFEGRRRSPLYGEMMGAGEESRSTHFLRDFFIKINSLGLLTTDSQQGESGERAYIYGVAKRNLALKLYNLNRNDSIVVTICALKSYQNFSQDIIGKTGYCNRIPLTISGDQFPGAAGITQDDFLTTYQKLGVKKSVISKIIRQCYYVLVMDTRWGYSSLNSDGVIPLTIQVLENHSAS